MRLMRPAFTSWDNVSELRLEVYVRFSYTRVLLLSATAFILGACGGNYTDPGNAVTPPLQPDSTFAHPEASHDGGQRFLFATVAGSPNSGVREFRLPLHDGEKPVITRSNIGEAVPVADSGSALFVGSFNTDEIVMFPLPLRPHSPSSWVYAGAADPSGLAINNNYAYESNAHEVLEYKLPLSNYEKPSGSVTGFPTVDELGVAVSNETLFIASTTQGTIGAYRLPLTANESPGYTIQTKPQDDAATFLAVDRQSHNLYVVLSSFPNVYDYALPYHTGEEPTVLSLRNEFTGDLRSVAVDDDHLFVGVGNTIRAYPLPLTPSSKPDAKVRMTEGPSGLAVSD
jgi:hypothetical protein